MSALVDEVLSSGRFQGILTLIAVQGVRAQLDLQREAELSQTDVNFALMAVSALTPENIEPAQDAVLRVCHYVLSAPDSSNEQKAAAMMLLDRVGNRAAANLAVARFKIDPLDYDQVPRGLAMDALQRRSQLRLPIGPNGELADVNPFQREFWDFVHNVEWVSVSAPTSAGKSHIVREWMVTELANKTSLRMVYIAPTRALVEEVGANFRKRLGPEIGVHTLPWDPEIANFPLQVFVLTQERLHLLQERSPSFSPDIIFIDEAQKISEGTRGILLTQVLDEAVLRNQNIRLIFASPMSKNPGVLFGETDPTRTVAALVGESVTVSQNLVYVNQKERRADTYEFVLHYNGSDHLAGELVLVREPRGATDRLPLVAATVGRLTSGNLVYANGPSIAEEYARLIFEALGSEADMYSDGAEELIDFAKGTVHERYDLATYARRGVAFHYGDMPLVLKAKVEEMFRRGEIRYLVCTSTLLEGVNLPCTNIFMRGPKKGPRNSLTMAEFWNLAGRAGRWTEEFEGNIYCVGTAEKTTWKQIPSERERTEIVPAAVRALKQSEEFVRYVESGAPFTERGKPAELESAFSWLSGRFLEHDQLDGLTGVPLSGEVRTLIRAAVADAVESVSIPQSLIKRHAGISPLAMQRMYDAFVEHGHPENLTLVPPTSVGAKNEYAKVLQRIGIYLGGDLAGPKRNLQLANLLVNWMSGKPLSRIIESKAKWNRDTYGEVSYPALIRKTLEDIEDFARYAAPRYLACYSDIVSAVATHLGQELDHQVADIDMMLELGVPRRTEMSFIAAGLSRATCSEIGNHVVEADLSPAECMEWIRTVDLEQLQVPKFALREIAQVRELLAARYWRAEDAG